MEGNKITYHQQVSYCGKARCRRCREGIGHGPYWYAYQTVNGRTVRTYVGKEPPAEVVAARSEASSRASQEFAQTILRFSTLGQFRLEQRGGDPQHGTSPSWEQSTRPWLWRNRRSCGSMPMPLNTCWPRPAPPAIPARLNNSWKRPPVCMAATFCPTRWP